MSRSGTDYVPPTEVGSLVFPVLIHLWGQPWDQATMNALASLRPSKVRVAWSSVTSDARPWRVTVWLGGSPEKAHVLRMEQEVEVGLAGDFEHGLALETCLKRTERVTFVSESALLVHDDWRLG